MSVKTQPQAMKDAYGERFSQQDLTDPVENQVPQPLETSTSKKGDLAFARANIGVDANPSTDKRIPLAKKSVPTSTVPKAKKPTR